MDDYQLSTDLWEPQARGVRGVLEEWSRGETPILYSPTGGGKTRQAIELFRWAAHYGKRGIFYVNRRLLIHQTSAAFTKAGIVHGVRAAECEDLFDPTAPFQIASADTEASRVINRGWWQLHDADVVVVDEAHLQRSKTMKWILKQYHQRGAKIVLLTATPVDMKDWATSIVVSGKLSEYRAAKALVMAVCKGISIVDLGKVARNCDGEFIMNGQKKKLYTQTIVGYVIDYWKQFNPDARPAMAYWPGKAESVWGTQQFEKLGIRWAHVDATDGYIDGQRYKLTHSLWTDILEQYRDGSIKGISSRFKCREGIDLPSTYHVILATPIGSLASYLQTVGRALRYSPETPDSVIVTDHGGAYHSHGSPNHDRDWHDLWKMSGHVASTHHRNNIRDGKKPESIVCWRCKTERPFGDTCPSCGEKSKKSVRRVVMESGEIVEHEGKILKKRSRQDRHDTEVLWKKMIWGWRKKGLRRTFKQAEGYFVHKHGYYPPRNLAMMPIREIDWYSKVCDVPLTDLTR